MTTLQWIKYRPGNQFPRVILLNEESWKMPVCASGFLCMNWATHHFLDGLLNGMTLLGLPWENHLHIVLSPALSLLPVAWLWGSDQPLNECLFAKLCEEEATLINVRQEAGGYANVIQASSGLTLFCCDTESCWSHLPVLLCILHASSDRNWQV